MLCLEGLRLTALPLLKGAGLSDRVGGRDVLTRHWVVCALKQTANGCGLPGLGKCVGQRIGAILLLLTALEGRLGGGEQVGDRRAHRSRLGDLHPVTGKISGLVHVALLGVVQNPSNGLESFRHQVEGFPQIAICFGPAGQLQLLLLESDLTVPTSFTDLGDTKLVLPFGCPLPLKPGFRGRTEHLSPERGDVSFKGESSGGHELRG